MSESAPGDPDVTLSFSEARKELIGRLADIRDSTVLVLLNLGSTGPPASMLRHLYEHLRVDHGQSHDRVSLVVYGVDRGPNLDLALRTLALLREFAREVEILVPSSATGWSTYLAIGADRIFMHPMGTLGGIDAAAALAAVQHFQGLVREAGGSPQDQRTALWMMAEALGPRQLGESRHAVERLHQGVRELVSGRFQRRQDAQNQALFEALADSASPLAQSLDRRKSKDLLALPVESTDPELAATMWDLYVAYEHALRLGRGPREGVVLESTQLGHVHGQSGWAQVLALDLH